MHLEFDVKFLMTAILYHSRHSFLYIMRQELELDDIFTEKLITTSKHEIHN